MTTLSRNDRENAVRKLKNFNVMESMQTLGDTYMHFDPEDESERELYDALGWALIMLKVQHATITAYSALCSDKMNEETRTLATKLLAACGITDDNVPEKHRKELLKKKSAQKKSPFRVIQGGK